jgi:hypothetical protein
MVPLELLTWILPSDEGIGENRSRNEWGGNFPPSDKKNSNFHVLRKITAAPPAAGVNGDTNGDKIKCKKITNPVFLLSSLRKVTC